MKIIVIGNGERPSIELWDEIYKKGDIVICADGGADAARNLGIVPDIIVGDLDSIQPDTLKHFSNVLN